MSKKIKRSISLLLVIIIVLIAIISTFFIVRYTYDKSIMSNVQEIYSNNIQNILPGETTEENLEETIIIDKLMLEIDGENIVGVLKIDKIGFHDLVYEGTNDAVLDKGVCHMENSSFLQGNVCLAGHNTSKIFGNLHTLQNGDQIVYTSFLGSKTYEITNITEIHETDWSLLQDTDENKLTLITCIKNKPFKRLCVQASEII